MTEQVFEYITSTIDISRGNNFTLIDTVYSTLETTWLVFFKFMYSD